MRRLEWGTWVAFVAFGMAMTSVPALLPFLRGWLNRDYAELSWLYAAGAAGNTAAYFAANRLVDRIGYGRLLPASLGVLAVGYGVLATSHAFSAWLVTLVLAGMAGSLIDVGSTRLVTALFRPRPDAALNRLNVFFGIGAILGPLLAMAAIDRAASPAPVFIVVGVLAAVGALTLTAAAQVRVDVLPSTVSPASGWHIPWIRRMAVAMLLYIAAEVGFGSWISPFAHRFAGVPTGLAALFPMAFWAGLVATRVISSTPLLRWRRDVILRVGAMLGAATSALALLGGASAPFLFLFAFFVGASLGPAFPTVLAAASARAPGHESVSYGVIYGVMAVAALVVPWGEGQIFGSFPLVAMAVTPLACLGMAAVIQVDRRSSAREAPD